MTDRQERFQWWNQKVIHGSRILVVGCGGLGSNQGKILIQMGVRGLDFVDGDCVEDSNRNRQFFTAADVGRPKVHQVLRNLEPFAVHTTLLRGYFQTFEEWVKKHLRAKYAAVCCGVDSIPTMMAVSRFGLMTKTPVIFNNVSEDGEACRIFIQRASASAACFACYQPQFFDYQIPRDQPCLPVPAIGDILHVAVGFGARATVSEILAVPIGNYNCRDISFTGSDLKRTIRKVDGCKLCGEEI